MPTPAATVPFNKGLGLFHDTGESDQLTNGTVPANKYAYVSIHWYDYQKIPAIRAMHPNTKILAYQDLGMMIAGPHTNGRPSTLVTKEQADAVVGPDGSTTSWYLHRTSFSSATRITSDTWTFLWAANIGRAAWLAAADDHFPQIKLDGFDGIMFDDVNTFCGHGFSPPNNSLEYTTDNAYRDAVVAAIGTLGPAARAQGLEVHCNIAIDPWNADQLVGFRNILTANSTDGVVREHWVYFPAGPLFGPAEWEPSVQLMADVEGTTYGPTQKFLANSYALSPRQDNACIDYGLASWYMMWNGSQNSAFGYDDLRPLSAFGRYRNNIGIPTAARQAVGVGYKRPYSLGLALINPHATTSQLFTLGATYQDVNGNWVTSVTLAPKTAMVLYADAGVTGSGGYIGLNPGFPTTYGPEIWMPAMHHIATSSKYFTIDHYNKLYAYKIKTPAWSGARTINALWLYTWKCAGSPLIDVQIFEATDEFLPTKSNFIAQTKRRGPFVGGWQRMGLTGQMETGPYPQGPFTGGQSLTLQPSTEYWVAVMPAKNTSGVSTATSTSYTTWQFFQNNGAASDLDKLRVTFTKDRAATWGYPGYETSDTLMPFWAMEVSDGTRIGFVYAHSSPDPGFDSNFFRVDKEREIVQLFTPPAGMGSIRQIEIAIGFHFWGTYPVNPLQYEIRRASDDFLITSGIFIEPDDARLIHKAGFPVRVKKQLPAAVSLTSGVQYRLHIRAPLESTTRSWKLLILSQKSTSSDIRVLNWESVNSKSGYKFKGGAITFSGTQDYLMPFTLSTIPATPTNFQTNLDLPQRRIRLTWSSSLDTQHSHWDLYRRVLGSTNWILLREDITETAFNDYTVGSNVRYQYGLVDVRSGNKAESTLAIAVQAPGSPDISTYPDSVAIPLGDDPNWYFVNNTDPSKNVKLTDVQSFTFHETHPKETFEFAGRSRKVVEASIDGPLGKEGNMSFLLHERDDDFMVDDQSLIWERYYQFLDLWGDPSLDNVTIIDNKGNAFTVEFDGEPTVEVGADERGRLLVSVNFVEVG